MISDEESALVDRLKAGDSKAQRTFYDLFFEPVVQWIQRKGLRQQEDLLEIVRETFLRAFRAIGQFRRASKLKTWIFALASHALNDYYKSPKHSPTQTGIDLGDYEESWMPESGAHRKSQADSTSETNRTTLAPSHNVDLEDLIRAERRHKILDALARLSPEHREVLVLRIVEKQSIATTAKIMDRTQAAVKMLQLRAAKALKGVTERDPYFNDGAPSKEVSH